MEKKVGGKIFMQYVGLRHFTYQGIRVEPGLVFPKLAVKNNLWLEQHGYAEEFRGREDNLVPCQQCPAKFIGLSDMQRHVNRGIHRDGRLVASEEGIRTPEMEAAMTAAQQAIPKEKPGYVEASPTGEITESKRHRK